MPSGVGVIRGDTQDARECTSKEVHNYEEKIRKRAEQRARVSEERRIERLMVNMVSVSKEPGEVTEDGEGTEDEASLSEGREIIQEGEEATRAKAGTKKGKVSEEGITVKGKKGTPSRKEARTPREESRVGRAKEKKLIELEVEGNDEPRNSKSKPEKDQEEIARLREELYLQRVRKENLVRERIRLERENEKLIVENYHLKKRKEEEGTRSEKRKEVMGKEAQRKGRREQGEREGLNIAIETSRREFREKERQIHRSEGTSQRSTPKERGSTSGHKELIALDGNSGYKRIPQEIYGTKAMGGYSKEGFSATPCRPEVAALFSLKKREGESLRSLVKRWEEICSKLRGSISEEEQARTFFYALSPEDPLFVELFKRRNEIQMKELRVCQKKHIMEEEE